MSLTPHSGRCTYFLWMTGYQMKKFWPPILCCMAVPLVVISTLSNLLLNAGCFWPVVLPLWDIAFHLGTNWRLLIQRRTWVGFLQSWRVVLSSAQQLLHPFFQQANINLIAVFLGNEKRGPISLEETLQEHMKDHLMLSAGLESQELNMYANNGA